MAWCATCALFVLAYLYYYYYHLPGSEKTKLRSSEEKLSHLKVQRSVSYSDLKALVSSGDLNEHRLDAIWSYIASNPRDPSLLLASDPIAPGRSKEKQKAREATRPQATGDAKATPSPAPPATVQRIEESATADDATRDDEPPTLLPTGAEHAAEEVTEDAIELPPPPQQRPAKQVSWFWNEVRVFFTIANVMYLLGALIVAGAMTFFMTKGFRVFGGYAMSGLSAVYILLFIYVAEKLIKLNQGAPAGLFYMMAICTVPLLTHGIQIGSKMKLDQWDQFFYFAHSNAENMFWVPMEITTLIASFLVMSVRPSPFILIPGWLMLLLLTRDMPMVITRNLCSVSAAFVSVARMMMSMLIALYILGLAYYYETKESIIHTTDLGFSFLPDSANWGYVAASLAIYYACEIGKYDGKFSLNRVRICDGLCRLIISIIMHHLYFNGLTTVIPLVVGIECCSLVPSLLLHPKTPNHSNWKVESADASPLCSLLAFVIFAHGTLCVIAPRFVSPLVPYCTIFLLCGLFSMVTSMESLQQKTKESSFTAVSFFLMAYFLSSTDPFSLLSPYHVAGVAEALVVILLQEVAVRGLGLLLAETVDDSRNDDIQTAARFLFTAGLILLGLHPHHRRLLLRYSPGAIADVPPYFSTALYCAAILQVFGNAADIQKKYGHAEHNTNVEVYVNLSVVVNLLLTYFLLEAPAVLFFLGFAVSRVVENVARLSMAEYRTEPSVDRHLAGKKFKRLTQSQRKLFFVVRLVFGVLVFLFSHSGLATFINSKLHLVAAERLIAIQTQFEYHLYANSLFGYLYAWVAVTYLLSGYRRINFCQARLGRQSLSLFSFARALSYLALNIVSCYYWPDPWCCLLNLIGMAIFHHHLWCTIRAHVGPRALAFYFTAQQAADAAQWARERELGALEFSNNPPPRRPKTARDRQAATHVADEVGGRGGEEARSQAALAVKPIVLNWEIVQNLNSLTLLFFGLICFVVSSLVPTRVGLLFGIPQLLHYFTIPLSIYYVASYVILWVAATNIIFLPGHFAHSMTKGAMYDSIRIRSPLLTASYYALNMASAVVYRQPIFCWLSVLSTVPFLIHLFQFLYDFVTCKMLSLFGLPNPVRITVDPQGNPCYPYFDHPSERAMRLHFILTAACMGAVSISYYFAASMPCMDVFCFKYLLEEYRYWNFNIGYVVLWSCFVYFTFEDAAFRSLFFRTLPFVIANLLSARYWSHSTLCWSLNFISVFFLVAHLDSFQMNLTAFINDMGFVAMLVSIGVNHFALEHSPWPIFIELGGMASLLVSLFYYSHSVSVVSMCAGFVIGVAALLCSSLPTPLYGYPFFFLGLLAFGACWMVRQNRRAKHADRGLTPTVLSVKTTLGRIGVVLGGCYLMRASPWLENVSIWWVGLGTIVSLLTLLLRRKTLLDILTAILLCMPLIAVGVMSQSKLILGAIYIFAGINILARTIFPNSTLFPFFLTVAGISFIYLGTVFDNDSFMELFQYQHALQSSGKIEKWCLEIVDQAVRRLATWHIHIAKSSVVA